MKRLLSVSALIAIAATPAFARPLVTTHVDNSTSNNIGTFNYTGAGTGFGGTVGNGVISFDSDLTNLYIRFTPGNALNDLVAIFLDTRSGGFTDSDMSDNGDGGRRALSNLAVNADDPFDANFLPDFGIVLGGFGTVLFELTAGNTDGHLNFVDFDGGNNILATSYAIPLATLGMVSGDAVDFFVAYTSDSGFLSNESIPAYDPLNSGGNPGFDSASPGFGNFNRFVTVPTPGTLALLGVCAMLAGRRRR